ncbi:hypothetical protein CSAL01_05411 [Colletotrichum salicis]|uniref:Major facilitator superfamily (MFS) profile domain-containing protein n=1 Tax=Colletotrichum salicis TaxID=1209931 RepID=A0A135RSL9_9PEZI|nr:hypothetical protein CSAL01_05411 [Colletotrichum salicis]
MSMDTGPPSSLAGITAEPPSSLSSPPESDPSRARAPSLGLLQNRLRRFSIRSSRSSRSDSSIQSLSAADIKGALGLNLLHEPSEPAIDFVFIHGPGGGSRKTWSHSAEASTFWPKDWLPNEVGFKHVRIHSYGYNSDWTTRKDSRLTVHDFGQALLADLYNSPCLRKNSDVSDFPAISACRFLLTEIQTLVIFVAHSMGGLVVKKAYLIATRDPTYEAIGKRIHTMFFLGTPHRGADSANFAKLVRQSAGYGPKAFLDDLIPGSGSLQLLFLQHEDKTPSTVAFLLRSLAFQMADSNFEVRRALVSMAEDDITIKHDDHHMLWTSLFVERIFKVEHTRPQFWVIDAIDECSSKGLPALVSMLSNIDQRFPARVLITSRPGGHIGRYLTLERTEFVEIFTGEEGSLKDIELFLNARFLHTSDTEQYRGMQNLVADVLAKSDGSFLWASLTIANLENAYSVEDKQDILRQIPPEMDKLYSRTLAWISASPSAELAKCVLKWTIYYAALNFSYHLIQGSSATESLLILLNKFFRTNVLTWIERTTTAGNLWTLQLTAQRLKMYLGRRAKYQSPVSVESHTIATWANDIYHILAAFHSVLLAAPSSIHFLVPHFCPPKSMIGQLFAKTTKRIKIAGPIDGGWNDRLTGCLFPEEACAIACCPRLLAVGLSSGDIKLYYLSGPGTFDAAATLKHRKRVRLLVFNRTSSLLASCSGQRTESILLHAPSDSDSSDESDKQVASWTPAIQIRLDSDHKLAALAYRNASISIWDLTATESLGNFEKEGFEHVYATPQTLDMVFNPIAELELLAISYKDGDIVACNPWTQEQTNKYHLPTSLSVLSATSDGRILAGAAEDGGIYLFLFETLQPIYQIERPDDQLRIYNIWGEAITAIEPADDRFLLVGRQDGTIDSLDWNADNSTLLSVDTTGRHILTKIASLGRASRTRTTRLLDRRNDGNISQVILSSNAESLLVCTGSSAKLIGIDGNLMGEEKDLNGTWWIKHPSSPSHLLAFQESHVHIYEWSTLHKAGTEIRISSIIPQSLLPKVHHAWISGTGSAYLAEGLPHSPEQATGIVADEASKIMTTTEMIASQSLRMTSAPIQCVIGCIRSSLFFLDTAGWVCSISPRHLAEASHFTRHFFVPLTWLPMATNLNVSVALISLTVTSYLIVAGIAPAFMGDIADQGGRRPAYILMFTLVVTSDVGLALQNSYPALLILRMVQSAGASGSYGAAYGIVADITTIDERGSYVGSILVFFGPVIAGLLTEKLSWRWIFWSLITLTGTYLLIVVTLLPESQRRIVGNGSLKTQGVHRSLFDSLVRHRKVHALDQDEGLQRGKRRYHIPNPFKCISMLFSKGNFTVILMGSITFAVKMTLQSSLSAQRIEVYNLNYLEAELIYPPSGVGGALASYTTGKILDRNIQKVSAKQGRDSRYRRGDDISDFPTEEARLAGIYMLVALSSVTTAGYGVSLMQEVHIAVPLIMQFISGATTSSIFTICGTLLTDLNPKAAAMVQASYNLVRCIGAGATIAAQQPLTNATGLGWSFGMFSLIMLFAAPLAMLLKQRGPRMEGLRSKFILTQEES